MDCDVTVIGEGAGLRLAPRIGDIMTSQASDFLTTIFIDVERVVTWW